MFKEIVDSYKLYYVGTLRWIFLGMGSIFTILAALVYYNLFKVNVGFILNDLSIMVILFSCVSSTEFTMVSKDYGKFVRSMPRSYEKHKIVLILNIFISIFSFFIFYFITGSVLKFLIKDFEFNGYSFFYILLAGLFVSGITISTFINFKAASYLISLSLIGLLGSVYNDFILGFSKREAWYIFISYGTNVKLESIEHLLKSPLTIMFLMLGLLIFLTITYKIALISIKKRW